MQKNNPDLPETLCLTLIEVHEINILKAKETLLVLKTRARQLLEPEKNNLFGNVIAEQSTLIYKGHKPYYEIEISKEIQYLHFYLSKNRKKKEKFDTHTDDDQNFDSL